MTAETPEEFVSTRNLIIGGRRIDGRTLLAKRYRTVAEEFIADVGGAPTAAELALIQRAAGLIVEIERIEAQVIIGEEIDADARIKLTNTLTRTLNALRAERKSRTPLPDDYRRTVDGHAEAAWSDNHD